MRTHVFTHVHTHVFTHVRTHVCTVHMHVRTHAYARAYMHTCVRTVRTSKRRKTTCVLRMHVRTHTKHVRTCVRTHAYACVRNRYFPVEPSLQHQAAYACPAKRPQTCPLRFARYGGTNRSTGYLWPPRRIRPLDSSPPGRCRKHTPRHRPPNEGKNPKNPTYVCDQFMKRTIEGQGQPKGH